MRRAISWGLLLASSVLFAMACGGDDEGDEPIGALDGGPETSPATDTGGPALSDSGSDQAAPTDAADGGDSGLGKTVDGGACGGDPVTLTSVFPQFAWKDGSTALTLTGTGFVAT